MDYFFSYLHFFASLIYVTLAVIILIKDIRSLLNQVCATVFVSMFIWSFAYIWIHHPATSKPTVELFENISSIGWIWFTFFHFWFAWLYTGRKTVTFFHALFFALSAIIPIILLYQQWQHQSLVAVHYPDQFGWKYRWNLNGWLYLYFIYYSAIVCIGLAMIISYRKKSHNLIVKRQSTVLIITGIFAMLFGTISNVILPLFMTNPPPSIANVSTLIWATGLAYVAIRYQMLDITPFIAAKEIITVMKDLLFLLDIDGRIISVNPSTLKTLGFTTDELVGRFFTEFIAESSISIDKLIYYATKKTIIEETFLICRSKEQIPVALSTELLPGIGIVCVASDISFQKHKTETLREAKRFLEFEVQCATKELQATNEKLTTEVAEKKQTVLALTESEKRFRVIFEHAPYGIYLADLEGNFVDGNPEILRIFGHEKDELKNRNLFDFDIFTPNEQEIFTGGLKKTLIGKYDTSKEVRIQRKDSTMLDIEIMSHPVKIGSRDLALGVVRDLTIQKKDKEERERLKRELHHAQKMDAIGRLAGGIAHEFNNLLTGIMGYAGILQKRNNLSQDKNVEILGKIVTLTKQASTLTTQLLTFARKGMYTVEDLNIHDVIDDVVELLKHTIDPRIHLKKTYRAPTSFISGDRSKIHSALLNLGINAKDTLTCGGTIEFSTDIVQPPSDFSDSNTEYYLEIVVSDDGVGIDHSIQSQIFEPFFTTKSIGKGTGLGLASVYGAVKQHNGSIEVSSSPNNGTKFIIHLPLLKTNTKQKDNREASIIPKVSGGKILVIEDMELTRDMTVDVLHDSGYEVAACKNGEEALEWYQKHYRMCNLVLLDLIMPGIGGIACYKGLKKINPSVKVIITTGQAKNEEIEQICNEDSVMYLQKPYEPEFLIQTISNILK